MSLKFTYPNGVRIRLLSESACEFLESLEREFGGRRRELLARRVERQKAFDRGEKPDFLKETEPVRRGDWKIAPTPADLLVRRVEITGPVDRKMIINALNSGADAFMADFEDSHSPTWVSTLEGQVNLHDAIRRTIDFTNEAGKQYRLNDKTATLLVRPRGWHLEEKNVTLNGIALSASLFDFGLYFFHNARELLSRGTGPYFYLPKMESHEEARLWNEVFNYSQDALKIPRGTIKCTVLIETILAAFEMDEILHELRNHITGLNCGRWDYIFSYIKKFRNEPRFLVPDRSQVGMTKPFLKAYSELLIQTCHRRGAHAMGGMAAQIPIKDNPTENARALERVRADKEREFKAGHDGTWVAHPGLVSVAMEVFTKPNQLDQLRTDVKVTASDLLAVPEGTITEQGFRSNIRVGIRYLEAWLRGNGCVPLYNMMEDAATAEISRTQLWQWVHHGEARFETGERLSLELFDRMLEEEMNTIRTEVGESAFQSGKFELAKKIFWEMTHEDSFTEFLTLKAYPFI